MVIGVLGEMQKGPPLEGPSLTVSGKIDLDASSNHSDLSLPWIPCLQSNSPSLAVFLPLRKYGDPGTIFTSGRLAPIMFEILPNILCRISQKFCPLFF